MIGITIMMIMIAAVLPVASTEIQREREEELIFRGRQYAEAIRCFQRKYGRFPTTLKEMIDTKPRTLRKLWKDPITNSNDWGLITIGTPLDQPGQQQGRPAGSASTSGGSFGGGTFGGGTFGGTLGGGRTAPTPTPSSDTPGPGVGSGFGGKGTSGDVPMMPIMGVYSKSTKKAFRVWQGHDTYDAWKFTKDTLLQADTGGAMGGPQVVPGPGVNPNYGGGMPGGAGGGLPPGGGSTKP